MRNAHSWLLGMKIQCMRTKSSTAGSEREKGREREGERERGRERGQMEIYRQDRKRGSQEKREVKYNIDPWKEEWDYQI